MKYKVYFELFGKKMQTEIYAKSEIHAKEIIECKIIFHKIEEVKEPVPSDESMLNTLKDLFGMK